VHGCNPTSSFFLEIEKVLPLAEAYNFFDKTLLGMECTQVNRLEICLVKLMQLTFTIAVSTAECEQSFSALKWIKSYLLSTMSENHLSNLAISLNLVQDKTILLFYVFCFKLINYFIQGQIIC